MTSIPSTFEGAIVKPGGGVRGPDETGISLVCVERKNGPPLFGEWDFIFAENGNDFGVELGRFGYPDRESAGSTSPYMRQKFSSEEIEYLKSILIPFFTEVESWKGWMPSALMRGGPLLGVRFASDWILDKQDFKR